MIIYRRGIQFMSLKKIPRCFFVLKRARFMKSKQLLVEYKTTKKKERREFKIEIKERERRDREKEK
jgi:hypothetical protein